MVNKSIFTLIFCLFALIKTEARELAIDSIPKTLLKNANVVVRNEMVSVSILSSKKYIIKESRTISILNAKGRMHSLIISLYDKNSSTKIKSAQLYDAKGKKIEAMKKSEVAKRSGFTSDHESLDVNDSKIKYFAFNSPKYPYTIKYTIVSTYSETMNLPRWHPIKGTGISCKKAQLEIKVSNDITLRSKGINISNPSVSSTNSAKTYKWSCNNISAINKTDLMPNTQTLFPSVQMAINNFSLYQENGQLDTWSAFSSFFYKLNQGRNELSNEEKNKIKAISNQHRNLHDKINALYKYMQNKTRYVSIQLGIGGWQPYKASFVAEKGYGDCKALSNYMHSILNVARINSYYTLIRSGIKHDPILEDFPSNQFNHAILCVPIPNDTIWLECTSQSLSPGYLSSFTANRKALLIAEKSGQLVNTQKLDYEDNLRLRIINADIDSVGNYSVKLKSTLRAMRQDELQSKISSFNKSKIKQDIENRLPNNSLIENYTHIITENKLPTVLETVKFKIIKSNLLKKKRIFVPINLMPLTQEWYNNSYSKKREIDFRVPAGSTDIDTTIFNTPKGFKIESIPKNISIKNKFGTYSVKIEVNKLYKNRMTIYRKLEIYANSYPKNEFLNFLDFIKKIKKDRKSKMVLVKSSTPIEKNKY